MEYPCLREITSFRSATHDIQAKPSQKFGLLSRYVRTTHKAELTNRDDISDEVVVNHPSWTRDEELLCVSTLSQEEHRQRFFYLTWMSESEYIHCQTLAPERLPWASMLQAVEDAREEWWQRKESSEETTRLDQMILEEQQARQHIVEEPVLISA